MSDDELPRGSCDCHVHVFGDAELFPPTANAAYPPPPASRVQLEQMHATLGIARAVLVQPTIYGTDHRALLDALRDRPQYRGVAIVNDQVTDEDLMTLHGAGIRAARFSLGGPIGGTSLPELEGSVGRIRELGWHAKFGGTARDFIANALWLRGLNCTAVLDHLAGTTTTDGLAAQMVDLSKDLLQTGNWWILLANVDRRSQTTDNWDDMVPYVQALASAAPKRAIWGTDWPHVLYGNRTIPDDKRLLAFLLRVIPDRTALEDILVHNPAQLYGFSDQSKC